MAQHSTKAGDAHGQHLRNLCTLGGLLLTAGVFHLEQWIVVRSPDTYRLAVVPGITEALLGSVVHAVKKVGVRPDSRSNREVS
jgi:hypothetical protein